MSSPESDAARVCGMTPIDPTWLRQYIDQWVRAAEQLDEDGKLFEAVLRRIDHLQDLVKAWKEHTGS